MRRRFALIVILLAIASISFAAFRGCAQRDRPPVARRMPSPNAYFVLLRAGKEIVDAKAVTEAAGFGTQMGKAPRVYSSAERADLVTRNRRALDDLRLGLKQDYEFPYRYDIDRLFPEYVGYRKLTHLLVLESKARADSGDWAGAMDACQDGLLLGEMIAHGDVNSGMGSILGLGYQGLVRPHMWDAIPHLTSAQAQRALARMEDIASHHCSLSKALECEKLGTTEWLRRCFAGKCSSAEVKDWPRLPGYIKSKVLRDYAAHMNRCIDNVQAPYPSRPEFPELRQSKNTTVAAAYLPADLILSLLCCSNGQARWCSDEVRNTQNGFITIALALHAYRLDRGDYPRALRSLVPTYLRSVPRDPFALRAILRYQRHGSSYVLWSQGPDCDNDNGMPIVNPEAVPNAPPKDRYHVDKDSVGDLVAGVNR